MALSDTWLRNMLGKESEKVQVKADRDGLSARVSCKGKISFQFRYRWNGKGERVDIGTYPATPLKDARDEVIRLRGELEQNRNPRLMKRMARANAFAPVTVEGVIREWHQKYCLDKVKSQADILRSFELHLFPAIGNLPHDDCNMHLWLNVLEPLAKKSPAIAVRLLVHAKQAHRWAVRRNIAAIAPINDLRQADLNIKLESRERVLNDAELVTIFRSMEASRFAPKYQLLIKLCLLFACRCGELVHAEKSHFDFDAKLWTVPHTHHKTGKTTKRSLIRPIIPEAEEMLKEMFDYSGRSKYLLITDGGSVPPRRGTITGLPGAIIASARRNLGVELAHWTIHDLRRTARTNLSELTEPHVAEMMLGHKLPGVWQVYDKHGYTDQMRRAYSLWWARVTALVYGDGKVSVLTLPS
ncbi:tyrosine-type recombinase/integrase [Pantoea agglomerans]|uniref:tyrosine-type recombinase/integrase n=1 Tax=Enterobacter agglomerans TaxID=549 RepID=UPI003C79A47F